MYMHDIHSWHTCLQTGMTSMHVICAWYTCMTYTHTLVFANMRDTNACHACMTYMHIKHTWHTCMTYTHTFMFANMNDINACHMCMIYIYDIYAYTRACQHTWHQCMSSRLWLVPRCLLEMSLSNRYVWRSSTSRTLLFLRLACLWHVTLLQGGPPVVYQVS